MITNELIWEQLRSALVLMARSQRFALDEVKLQGALLAVAGDQTQAVTPARVEQVCLQAGWLGARVMPEPLRERLPLLVCSHTHGWGLLTQGLMGDEWLLELPGQAHVQVGLADLACVLRLLAPDARTLGVVAKFEHRLDAVLRMFRGPIAEAVAASLVINMMAVVVSFFSMQVYDKVIPTRSTETLVALLGGVLLLIFFEWLMKWARAKVMDRAVVGLDSRLGRDIFERLLSVRLDQMPASVGSLASQLRGYEQVRNFFTASTLFALVDVPAALIFLAVISWIASPWVAVIPLVMALVALGVGLLFRRRVRRLAAEGQREVNMKTGMLVETVEGAETIKSTHGGWFFLAKWIDLCSKTIQNDLKMRHTNDGLQYFMASMQQFSFVLLISMGALLVIEGNITMGCLIACSILGGRVLSAVMMVPNLMVQHAHARGHRRGGGFVQAGVRDHAGRSAFDAFGVAGQLCGRRCAVCLWQGTAGFAGQALERDGGRAHRHFGHRGFGQVDVAQSDGGFVPAERGPGVDRWFGRVACGARSHEPPCVLFPARPPFV